MTQFYVVEIKRNQADELEHEVYWAWDDDPDVARLKGESKYHEVLAAAAVSDMKLHAAIMFSEEGYPVMNQCYKHVASEEV